MGWLSGFALTLLLISNSGSDAALKRPTFIWPSAAKRIADNNIGELALCLLGDVHCMRGPEGLLLGQSSMGGTTVLVR
jgi:hypothetical protein